MYTKLRIQCEKCNGWNEIEVELAMFSPETSEPKAQVFIKSYLSTKTQKCEKCKTVLAEPDELFRIISGEAVRYRMKSY